MTFTYNLASGDANIVNISKVRLEIDDVVNAAVTAGAGVRPNGSNLSDEEITVLLDREGSVLSAVAGACDLLARAWTRVADLDSGPIHEKAHAIANDYAKRAQIMLGTTLSYKPLGKELTGRFLSGLALVRLRVSSHGAEPWGAGWQMDKWDGRADERLL